ncbi:glucose-6-phosphate exchanger SLC37A2 isoform X2 [Trichogramma pretiosum]|nr:glucose-6-phosphate exchanger SLC37A2 isoform X2 [Trichogramma pretiosum]
MWKSKLPWGVLFLQKCTPMRVSQRKGLFTWMTYILTYCIYATYHMTRKAWSVSKLALHRNCSGLIPPPGVDPSDDKWCQWAPFDTADGDQKLGYIDTSFLGSYTIGMFVSGAIAERMNLRIFITIGMAGTVLFCIGMGEAYVYAIHNMEYFIFVMMIFGAFQTSGWPACVTIMSHWMNKNRLGLGYGTWNTHTSVGNILGGIIPGNYVESDWSKCFIVPAYIMSFVSVIAYLFLIPNPADLEDADLIEKIWIFRNSNEFSSELVLNNDVEVVQDCGSNEARIYDSQTIENDAIISINDTLENPRNSNHDEAINFWKAVCLPGVLEYSLALLFAKAVSYVFLFWLTSYLANNTKFSAADSSYLSTAFDIGGAIGSPLIGYLSDVCGKASACLCVFMLALACPLLFLYNLYCPEDFYANAAFLNVLGILANSPYSLITTSVCAVLGSQPILGSNTKAMATVTAIIDGTGSVGATIGPFAASWVSSYGWNKVFYLLIVAEAAAILSLSRQVVKEIKDFRIFSSGRPQNLEEGLNGSSQSAERIGEQ